MIKTSKELEKWLEDYFKDTTRFDRVGISSREYVIGVGAFSLVCLSKDGSQAIKYIGDSNDSARLVSSTQILKEKDEEIFRNTGERYYQDIILYWELLDRSVSMDEIEHTIGFHYYLLDIVCKELNMEPEVKNKMKVYPDRVWELSLPILYDCPLIRFVLSSSTILPVSNWYSKYSKTKEIQVFRSDMVSPHPMGYMSFMHSDMFLDAVCDYLVFTLSHFMHSAYINRIVLFDLKGDNILPYETKYHRILAMELRPGIRMEYTFLLKYYYKIVDYSFIALDVGSSEVDTKWFDEIHYVFLYLLTDLDEYMKRDLGNKTMMRCLQLREFLVTIIEMCPECSEHRQSVEFHRPGVGIDITKLLLEISRSPFFSRFKIIGFHDPGTSLSVAYLESYMRKMHKKWDGLLGTSVMQTSKPEE